MLCTFFPFQMLVKLCQKKKSILFGCTRKEITLVQLAGARKNCRGVDPQHWMRSMFLIRVVCSDVDCPK
jgi:hypothetical protein